MTQWDRWLRWAAQDRAGFQTRRVPSPRSSALRTDIDEIEAWLNEPAKVESATVSVLSVRSREGKVPTSRWGDESDRSWKRFRSTQHKAAA